MSFISPSVALYDLLGCSFETQRTSSQTEESSHLIPLPALDFLETQREHSAQIRRLLSSALPPTISPEFLETSQPFWSVQRESAPPRASRQAPPPTLSSSAEYTSDKDDRIDTQTIRLSIDQEREVEILRSLCMSSKLIGGSSSVKEHLASLTHPHAEVDMDDEEEEDNAMPDPPSSTNPSLSENPHQRLIARVCSLLNELGNLDASAISYVCQQLQMSQWPDLELSEVAREFVTASQSKSHSSCFILNVLFPKVNHLTALASRALFSCLTSVANNHPTSVMENLVRPLVFGSVASSPLKNVQTELLVRLIKQSIFPKHPILISDFLVYRLPFLSFASSRSSPDSPPSLVIYLLLCSLNPGMIV